jgi:hypothetical protein
VIALCMVHLIERVLLVLPVPPWSLMADGGHDRQRFSAIVGMLTSRRIPIPRSLPCLRFTVNVATGMSDWIILKEYPACREHGVQVHGHCLQSTLAFLNQWS